MSFYRRSFTVPTDGLPHSLDNARKAARTVLLDHHKVHGFRPTSRLQSYVYPPVLNHEEALTAIENAPGNRFRSTSALALVVPVYGALEKSRNGETIIEIAGKDEMNWQTLIKEGLERIREGSEILTGFTIIGRTENWTKGTIDIKVEYEFSVSPDRDNDVESYEIAII